MYRDFEVRWQGVLPADPQQVWDAFTVHTAGWIWEIAYEPRVGGAERGLTAGTTRSTTRSSHTWAARCCATSTPAC